MEKETGIFTAETFRFFRELARNNHKPWMDANRERYRGHLVEPFHVLLDRLAPAVRKLDQRFVITGRTGDNFSRINRDIRFANDKTPYYSQLYLRFSRQEENGADGQLYVGVSADAVTAGFRVYAAGRQGVLGRLGIPRLQAHGAWLKRQKRRLATRYESYWYSSERGEWKKHSGWPLEPEEWKRMKGWIVRRKFKPAAATRPGFVREAEKIFREVLPLYQFTLSEKWKP